MLTFNLSSLDFFFLMVLMGFSTESNDIFCNCNYQKLPNSNFVHSCPNLCIPFVGHYLLPCSFSFSFCLPCSQDIVTDFFMCSKPNLTAAPVVGLL